MCERARWRRVATSVSGGLAAEEERFPLVVELAMPASFPYQRLATTRATMAPTAAATSTDFSGSRRTYSSVAPRACVARSPAASLSAPNLTRASASLRVSSARATAAPSFDSVCTFLSSVSKSAMSWRKSRVSRSTSGDIAGGTGGTPAREGNGLALACICLLLASTGTLFPGERHQECDNRDDQKDHEEDLGDSSRPGSDSTEAKQRGNQRHDEKHDGVVEHGNLLRYRRRTRDRDPESQASCQEQIIAKALAHQSIIRHGERRVATRRASLS